MGNNNGNGTVVVVEDDEFMRHYLSETLAAGGYDCQSFPHSAAAIGWLAAGEQPVDLMLSDIDMPGMSGLDLLRTVKTVSPDLPFILISGMCDLPMASRALRAGAADYLLKPVCPADLLGLVSRHLDTCQPGQLGIVKAALKRSLIGQNASGANLERDLLPIFDSLGFKRFETLQHSRRVSAFALLIARDLRMDGESFRALEIGSLLHDIGKAGVPLNVLMKPGKLNAEEWAIMKMHPQLGVDLLAGIPGLDREREIVFSHHEHFDGNGYPQKLAGEAIPLGARVFSVADALDALTSDRCYRAARTLPAARAELHRVAGSQLDPAILDRFDQVPDREFEAIRNQFPDEPRPLP